MAPADPVRNQMVRMVLKRRCFAPSASV